MNKPCCPTCGRPSTLYGLRAKPIKEDDAYRKRIRNLLARFQLEGYTTYDADRDTVCAVAQIMSVEGETEHMQTILRQHMERIIASGLLEAA